MANVPLKKINLAIRVNHFQVRALNILARKRGVRRSDLVRGILAKYVPGWGITRFEDCP